MLPQRQGKIERRTGMLRISLPEILEGASSFLVVKAIDMIEARCGTFLELRRFQTLGEKWICEAAD